jgi:hypothetical protein
VFNRFPDRSNSTAIDPRPRFDLVIRTRKTRQISVDTAVRIQ